GGGRRLSWREACDLGRYRPSPLMRWLHALGVVAAYVVIAAALLWLDVGDFGTAPPWTVIFFFSSRRRHTSSKRDWSSDVCSSDLRSTCQPGAELGRQLRSRDTQDEGHRLVSRLDHLVDR